MRTIVLLSLCLSFLHCAVGQSTIGIPDIKNYSRSEYNAAGQNWEMAQDKNGIMYFANTEGLLTYDGSLWKLYQTPKQRIVRAITMGNDNKIYVGGQGELGYFSPQAGKLVYTDLNNLISKTSYPFSDIWDIVTFGDDVFYRSRKEIFQYSNNTITTYADEKEWRFLGKTNTELIAQNSEQGLVVYRHGVWEPFLPGNVLPKGFLVTALVTIGKDSSLIATINSGLYILHGNDLKRVQLDSNSPLSKLLILNCSTVNNEYIAIGTNRGCYFINKKGELIQNISKDEGLQNNTVLSLFLDHGSNLWLGLENGIDFIAYNNAIKHIYPQTFNEGIGYSSIIYKNELYLGTSIGLYKVPVSNTNLSFIKGKFHSIPDVEGSAWALREVKGRLIMSHHEGAFDIENGQATPISKQTGYWDMLPLNDPLDSSLVIAGDYNGIDFFKYNGKSFVDKGNLIDFNEAARFMAIDKNQALWVAHPFRGVFKISLSNLGATARSKLYTEKNGLPSSLKNQLFALKDRIAVTTPKGVYEYDKISDTFVKSTFFQPFFNDRDVRFLNEDKAGNIWFIEDKDVGVVDFSGSKPQIIYFPEISGKLFSNYYHVNPIDENNVIVGCEKGFYHINFKAYKKIYDPLTVGIRSVRMIAEKDSLLFGGYESGIKETANTKGGLNEIPHDYNSLHFDYSSTAYERQASLQYSYFLKGFDKEWSSWSKKKEKEYTNLPPGAYVFSVKAKSNIGNESTACTYSFTILPPWYGTKLAYAFYILLGILLAYLVYKGQRRLMQIQQRKHEEEQNRLQYVHQLEMERSEKEIMTLKNQQLTSEIGFKNTELASVAMHLVQKGELLSKIKDELKRLRKDPGFDQSQVDFKTIIQIFREESEIDQNWDLFANYFDNLNGDFLKALREAHVNLSSTELKLSAYLRMNLSSKEIAKLMNISVRGVEVSRYRLRKKLKIPSEVTFYNFLSEYSTEKAK